MQIYFHSRLWSYLPRVPILVEDTVNENIRRPSSPSPRCPSDAHMPIVALAAQHPVARLGFVAPWITVGRFLCLLTRNIPQTLPFHLAITI